jgi:hypothetical protein
MKRVLGGLLVASALAGGVAPAADGATFTVNRDGDMSDTDSGDGVCDSQPMLIRSQCTLRAALEEAAADSQSDLIRFNLPSSSDLTISPATELPPIDTPVTIDGYTQPGSSPNTKRRGTNAVPLIQLEGSAAGGAIDGLNVLDGSTGTRISGLIIRDFDRGIDLRDGSFLTRISGNFIGTSASGDAASGNAVGIAAGGEQASIGGLSPADRNVVSGNESEGILVGGASHDVEGNLIGTTANGTGELGNGASGIFVLSGSHDILTNVIAFNSDDAEGAGGVAVHPSARGVAIESNSIFANGGLAIDLGNDGPTANDGALDPDGGANDRQNHPVLASAVRKDGKVVVKGTLDSVPSENFRIAFYSNPAPDGGDVEAKKLVHTKNIVVTDDEGSARFRASLEKPPKVGAHVTATATSLAKNTSEVSPSVEVEAARR